MIFKSLEFENFRQFAGEQTLKFSTDKRQNVTVVHGYNGSGKTTLLNGLTWLFYGKFTPDFTGIDHIANEGEWAKLSPGEELTVAVDARFEHDDRTYIAKRRRIVEKLEGNGRNVKVEGDLSLEYLDENGEMQELGGAQDAIEQLLPEPLYPFFFFNGERIEQLANPDAYERVETGVKVLLDIELLDRTVRHLEGKTAKTYRDRITEHTGHEGEKVRKERRELEQKKEAKQEAREQIISNRDSLQRDRERIDEKLRAQPRLAKLQQQRESKEEKFHELGEQLEKTRNAIARIFSNDGYLAMAQQTLQQAKDVLDDAHDQGQLPPPLKRQFVDDLMDEGECLCGRTLDEGTDHWEHVLHWKQQAGSAEIAQVATGTRADLDGLNRRGKEFTSELQRLQNQRDTLKQREKRVEEELSQISTEIGDKAIEEDYSDLETRRHKIDERLTELKMDVAKIDQEIDELDERIAEKDKEIKSLKKADRRGERAQRRLEATENVASALKQIRDVRQANLREDVSETLNEIWNNVSIKNYTAALDREYRLKLTKKIGGTEEAVRGASTGEKQVLSLAFVSALVKKAKELAGEQANSSDIFSGGLYPLVMDSPFGSLEVEYRREVANWVPKLAPQIIVLVSETQWRNEVEREIISDIGREWILEVHTTKHGGKEIELHDRNYPYVVESSDGYERTELQEVEV